MKGVETISRPPKPIILLENEKKSHRTKKEMAQRKNAEEALLTGFSLKERQEVKENSVAHKEFKRLNELLSGIGKNDAIYEGIINRYCLIYAECLDLEEKKESFYRDIEGLINDKEQLVDSTGQNENGRISLADYYKLKQSMQQTILGIDKQLQSKRKMLMDIEKENIMTISSALKNIPKQSDTTKNPLMEALCGS